MSAAKGKRKRAAERKRVQRHEARLRAIKRMPASVRLVDVAFYEVSKRAQRFLRQQR